MQSLRGRLITYFIEEARGRAVTLERLTRGVGEPTTDKGMDRVRQAVNNLKSRPADCGLEIVTDVRGTVWRQANYVAPDVEIVPDPLPEQPEDEEPTEEHLCPYAVAGVDAEGDPIVRNTRGQLFRLKAI